MGKSHPRSSALQISVCGNNVSFGVGQFLGTMMTYMRMVEIGQKSPAFHTKMVKFLWGIYLSLMQIA